MSILMDKNTRVIVTGITGREGKYHTSNMLKAGTNVVGGVTPGKGGQSVEGVPVFDTAREAVAATEANAACIFVPASGAADSIMECASAGIKLIVCITENIPVIDMTRAVLVVREHGATLIGPNCPGMCTPGLGKIGIIPYQIFQPGAVGFISRSGTATYEVVSLLTEAGIGQSTCIGIGGDPIIGTTTKEAVELLMNDPETSGIVMIGEIGGNMEAEAARWVRVNNRKPVVGFIAGQTAPAGRRMGHAGAIIGGAEDTAAAKMKILGECGIHVVQSPADIGATMAGVIKK